MNKKGFMFIETIMVAVILLVGLMVVYVSYNRLLIRERKKLYSDDIAYVYEAMMVRNEIDRIVERSKITGNMVLGSGSAIFQDNQDIKKVYSSFNVGQVLIIDKATITNSTKLDNFLAKYNSLNDEFVEYVKTISPHLDGSVNYNYVMAVQFDESESGKSAFYAGNSKDCEGSGKNKTDCKRKNKYTWVYYN